MKGGFAPLTPTPQKLLDWFLKPDGSREVLVDVLESGFLSIQKFKKRYHNMFQKTLYIYKYIYINKICIYIYICNTGKVNQIENYRQSLYLLSCLKLRREEFTTCWFRFLLYETIVGHQFGFRSELSTADAVDDLIFLNRYESLNLSQHMVAIFLDLSKDSTHQVIQFS